MRQTEEGEGAVRKREREREVGEGSNVIKETTA